MMRAAARKQELPALVLTQTRSYLAPLRVEFTEDVSAPKVSKESSSLLDEWKGKKQNTEQLMKLMQTYKDLGDAKAEPLLKYHNPRTFEDLSAPVPNFRAQNLKAGDVAKFFDNVLVGRASNAADSKSQWWAQRKADAQAAVSGKNFAPFATVPVAPWQLGKSVSLEGLNKVADSYVSGLEPKRKLNLPVVPANVKDSIASFAKSVGQDKSATEVTELLVKALAEKAVVTEGGKPVEGFKVVSKAVAQKVIATRRAEVHERFLKLWAKKLLVAPEIAVVPLKDVDSQLASKFEGVAPQFGDLMQAVSMGTKTMAERVAAAPAFESFLLKREKANTVEDFPPTELETQATQAAADLEDPEAAIKALLGPALQPLGSGEVLLSEQIRAITAHKYTPDRYMYREGMKLADKVAAEEAALKEELKSVYGEDADVKYFQRNPRTPVQQLFDSIKEAGSSDKFAAEKAAASTPFLQYAVAKKEAVLSDPTNIAFDEVLYPGLAEELMELELADLHEQELAIEDAEEEELWMLTLTQQFKHIQKHFGIDLPHSVIAHMDPILIKKIDWETTNGLEDLDISFDDMGAEYAKEQWGLENLSHHFLPLIRYRRQKARAQKGSFEPELVAARV